MSVTLHQNHSPIISWFASGASFTYRQHEGHEAEGLGAEVSLDSGAGQLARHYEGQLERH